MSVPSTSNSPLHPSGDSTPKLKRERTTLPPEVSQLPQEVHHSLIHLINSIPSHSNLSPKEQEEQTSRVTNLIKAVKKTNDPEVVANLRNVIKKIRSNLVPLQPVKINKFLEVPLKDVEAHMKEQALLDSSANTSVFPAVPPSRRLPLNNSGGRCYANSSNMMLLNSPQFVQALAKRIDAHPNLEVVLDLYEAINNKGAQTSYDRTQVIEKNKAVWEEREVKNSPDDAIIFYLDPLLSDAKVELSQKKSKELTVPSSQYRLRPTTADPKAEISIFFKINNNGEEREVRGRYSETNPKEILVYDERGNIEKNVSLSQTEDGLIIRSVVSESDPILRKSHGEKKTTLQALLTDPEEDHVEGWQPFSAAPQIKFTSDTLQKISFGDSPPPFVLVQLKDRATPDYDRRSEIYRSNHIDFPKDRIVDLSAMTNDGEEVKYRLEGFIRLVPGHYMSYLFDNEEGRWVKFDDSHRSFPPDDELEQAMEEMYCMHLERISP